jgi:hypothetical protein
MSLQFLDYRQLALTALFLVGACSASHAQDAAQLAPATVNAQGRPGSIFIPGPNKPTPDAPYTGPQASGPEQEAAQNVLQRLLENPQFQQRIEEMRPILHQRPDRVRQDNQAVPDPPPATAKPSEGKPQ